MTFGTMALDSSSGTKAVFKEVEFDTGTRCPTTEKWCLMVRI